MGKDVLYETLNREDLNWRKCHGLIAYKTVMSFRRDIKKAFVVDDSVKQRFGKNMPGISSHFDPHYGTAYDGVTSAYFGLKL